MLSPIQTIRHSLRSVEFKAADEETGDAAFQCHITLQHSKLDDHWHVQLGVAFEGKDDAPVNYRGRVEYEGLFKIHADFPEEKREDLVRMNGGAILYGAVREYIVGMTCRSKHGVMELPTIDARMFVKKPGSGATAAAKQSGHPKLAQPANPALPAAPAPPRSPAAKKAPKPKGEA
ncbi:MAG: hypothetical protein B9S38_02285 [Verrucomicrobiia bacterium Tous-C4TDCM]|nr:MAG: hypothetical protein B9S38_02285 [Verrucomicrobiae bacterium Tous-C4TDCM]